MTLNQLKKVNPNEGAPVDVQYLNAGPQSVLVYATLLGNFIGWDLRSPVAAWSLKNNIRLGLITSFCLDAQKSYLTLGTSNGRHITWDLRFQLPISTIEHPSGKDFPIYLRCVKNKMKYLHLGSRIRKIISHPFIHSYVISSVQGNNEVSVWNIESGFREKVLWGSPSPPLSKIHVTHSSVCAMQAGCIDRSGFLLAGGSDQRIRFWDLQNPVESFLAVPAPGDGPAGNYSYESRLIDGSMVVYENGEHTKNVEKEEYPKPGPEQPSAGHRDCISDIALCKASQCFMVSASKDGVIKVWK